MMTALLIIHLISTVNMYSALSQIQSGFLLISLICLGISATHLGLDSWLVHFIPPPSCLPLLHTHYGVSLLLWRLWLLIQSLLPAQVSLIHAPCLPAIPSPTTHCSLSSLYHATPQLDRLPSFFPPKVWASPFTSKLAVTTGRIEFVIPESSPGQALRTSFSPPVAPHHTSRCRSYDRLQGGKRFPWRGLSPLWHCTLSGALVAIHELPLQGKIRVK